MVIVGKFSGRIYPDGFHDTEECTLLLTDDEYKNKEYQSDVISIACLKCLGCPYAKKMTEKNKTPRRNTKAMIREIKKQLQLSE